MQDLNAENVFAIIGNSAAAAAETIRLKMIDVGGVNYPIDYFRDAYPYAFSFTMGNCGRPASS